MARSLSDRTKQEIRRRTRFSSFVLVALFVAAWEHVTPTVDHPVEVLLAELYLMVGVALLLVTPSRMVALRTFAWWFLVGGLIATAVVISWVFFLLAAGAAVEGVRTSRGKEFPE